jgi:hypothetical protein
MERRQVNVLLSDYDGTLCPTTSVIKDDSNSSGTIPNKLEQVLECISQRIPICIISSKEFAFLHERAKFTTILSCVLGIETVIHNPHYSDNEIDNLDCISQKHLIASSYSLMVNSRLLHKVMKILQNHKCVMMEEKYDSAKEILMGLTFDYRHLENWQLFKEKKEPKLRETIQTSINANLVTNSSSKDRPFIQKYSSHPFLDVYGVECNKGIAFDIVLSQLKQEERGGNVMYLGRLRK